MDAITLWGVEVGFWPALPLLALSLALFLFGTFGTWYRHGVMKAWSGSGESNLRSRFRIFLPRLCFFLATASSLAALADIARNYVVVSDKYATNRLYIDIDNSSSMYKFGGGPPIHCTDESLKRMYPRIFDACRVILNVVDSTERYSKMKNDGSSDQIGLLRFGLYSFVELYGTTDYERIRRRTQEMNWRDLRTGIFTEIHLALWDLFQVALQRNFRGEAGVVSLNEADRAMLVESLRPTESTRYDVPHKLRDKFIAMREDLRDTAFIFVTDAEKGEFESRLNKAPVSFVKMLQLAAFLQVPVHVISISMDHEIVRKLVDTTGFGPPKGEGRGGFHLIKGENNFEDVDAIVEKILSTRFRIVSSKERLERKSYTTDLALLASLFLMLGTILSLSSFGREITKGDVT